MKALVTGSHGFIGKNLVEALLERGYSVAKADIKTGQDVLLMNYSIPKDCDVIFHLACVNQMDAVTEPEENIKVNALGTKIMAMEAERVGAKLIYTSTASVYGNAEEIPTYWETRPSPESDYAVAKLAGEGFIRNTECDWAIFRLSNVYGPHQTVDNPYCGVIGKFIDWAMHEQPLQIISPGLQTRDFTYVGDVVEHLINAAEGPIYGTYNLSRGEETSIIALANAISDLVYDSGLAWTTQRPIDGINRRCLVSDFVCPTDLKTGLEKTINWVYANAPALSAQKASVYARSGN